MFGPNAVPTGALPAAPPQPDTVPSTAPVDVAAGAPMVRDALGDVGGWLAQLREDLADEIDPLAAAQQAALITWLESVSRRGG